VESGFSLVSRCFVWLGGSLFFASLFLIQWRAYFSSLVSPPTYRPC
jgi:hypothetical protein